MTLRFATAAAAFLLLATQAGAATPHYDGEKLAKEASITIDQAEAIAIKARPGVVTDRELEKEDGGLRYSFDIKYDGVTYEVGIDAKTGAVLENGAEGKNPD